MDLYDPNPIFNHPSGDEYDDWEDDVAKIYGMPARSVSAPFDSNSINVEVYDSYEDLWTIKMRYGDANIPDVDYGRVMSKEDAIYTADKINRTLDPDNPLPVHMREMYAIALPCTDDDD